MPIAIRCIRAVIASLALIVCASALMGCTTLTRADLHAYSPFFVKCGGAGEACCRPPGTHAPSLGPLVACNVGLGCDVQTNKCVSPCGGTGQVCCDGPETRAVKWTADGKVYSPNTWDMQEMCRAGACDVQSHRCFACGTAEGQPCCPPDAAQATARCIGQRLFCEFAPDTFYRSGTCRACGIRGRAPCDWGCDPGLDLLKGLCEICGGEGQVRCDAGCKPGLGIAGGVCRTCGGVNQIPCDKGCNFGLGTVRGVCAACGGTGQPPCDGGCGPGRRAINGVCTPCGGLNQPPCDKGCNYPYRVSNGVCKQCGAQGQVPCDLGCDGGLQIINGLCARPGTSDPPDCAQANEACVADFVPGKHCCKPPVTSTPLLCNYGTCQACVPRGQGCKKGQQMCCTYGDVCRLEVDTQRETCGIPD
jgi:hypothetical protein